MRDISHINIQRLNESFTNCLGKNLKTVFIYYNKNLERSVYLL